VTTVHLFLHVLAWSLGIAKRAADRSVRFAEWVRLATAAANNETTAEAVERVLAHLDGASADLDAANLALESQNLALDALRAEREAARADRARAEPYGVASRVASVVGRFLAAHKRAALYLPGACPADAAEDLRCAREALAALDGWSDATGTGLGEAAVELWGLEGSPPGVWVGVLPPAGWDSYRIVRLTPSGAWRAPAVWGPIDRSGEPDEPPEPALTCSADCFCRSVPGDRGCARCHPERYGDGEAFIPCEAHGGTPRPKAADS
jgi:hypothetical protein